MLKYQYNAVQNAGPDLDASCLTQMVFQISIFEKIADDKKG